MHVPFLPCQPDPEAPGLGAGSGGRWSRSAVRSPQYCSGGWGGCGTEAASTGFVLALMLFVSSEKAGRAGEDGLFWGRRL